MSDIDPVREAAVKRLKEKRDFRTHIFMYLAVNLFLVVIWAVGGRGFFWPIFVIGGWGIGIAGHAWSIWGEKPISEDDVQREMKRGGGIAE